LAELAGLFNSVSQMKPRLTTNVAKRVSSHLLINLSRRFHLDNMLSSHRTALLAAILDVRMKYLRFLPVHMRDAAWDILKEEYEIEKAASANQSTASANSTQRAAKPASTANSDHEISGSSYFGEPETESANVEDFNEVSEYRKITASSNPRQLPLLWWSEQVFTDPNDGQTKPRFPLLQQLAQRILIIPPSSAPAESIFSVCAAVNDKSRGSIDKIELFPKYIFSRHNLKTIQQLGIDLTPRFREIQKTKLAERRQRPAKRQRTETDADEEKTVILDDQEEDEMVEY
jgi:hypothetical protein